MKLEIKNKPEQALIPTLEMQRSLQILQMPLVELSSWVQAHIEQNPLLEYQEPMGEPVDETESQESFSPFEPMASSPTLYEHLKAQAKDFFSSPDDMASVEEILGHLDDRGFIGDAVVNEKILHIMQTFDPPGVAARTLQESLLLQLERQGKDQSLVYEAIEHHFEAILHNRYPHKHLIAADLKLLDFHPGRRFHPGHSCTIIPDLLVRGTEGKWNIEINASLLPPFQVRSLEWSDLPPDSQEFVQHHLREAKWLLRSLEKRYHTLKKIGHYLLEKQADFFRGEKEKLRPLTLQEIAADLGLHESTASRAVSDKYLSCHLGLFPLKMFFSSKLTTSKGKLVSSRTVKQKISELIAQEDKMHPLSDEEIAQKLVQEGTLCARRTVAKYRAALGLLPAHLRRS
ncbi:MAG: RNA polymerase factor sigma-54 [Verrucomicrobia bacterium]|nr:RNA polymerase factor sigma-54 [Verrucomicrobiota bacterium]